MTGHLDEVDREFIKSLFPEYLLEQPVAYDLLWIYRENKNSARRRISTIQKMKIGMDY